MKLQLSLALLLVAFRLTPAMFALKAASTGTPTCNGSNLSLAYQSLGYNNDTGSTIPFTVEIPSFAAASGPTCSGDYAIYDISASKGTITFDKPVIGSDTGTYDPITTSFEIDANGYSNYLGIFSFTDGANSYFDNVLEISLTSPTVANPWGMDASGNLTFDPGGQVIINATGSAPPAATPEPASWMLLVPGLAAIGLVRRRFAKSA